MGFNTHKPPPQCFRGALLILPQLRRAITRQQRWGPSGGKSLLPQTGHCLQDIKECSVTSDCFQKGIKNEGLSPAGKTGSYSFYKGHSPFLTLNKRHRLCRCRGHTHGAPSPVSALLSVDVHQTHRSWSPRPVKSEATLNMDIGSGFLHSHNNSWVNNNEECAGKEMYLCYTQVADPDFNS